MTSISVVTINRNTGHEIDRTCASIRAQEHPFEWVVIDGGSTDRSVGILRDHLRPGDIFVSEPDQGIADAFNKGLARCTGEAVLFLNAGDEFAGPDALGGLVRSWDRSRWRWIIGAGAVVDTSGRTLFTRRFRSPTVIDAFSLVRYNCQILHQSVLAERSLFMDHGFFDVSFRLAMDYELWIRWISLGIAPQCSAHLVCRFHRGGASGDPRRNYQEDAMARFKHGKSNPLFIELGLQFLAWVKAMIKGRYGRWLYRAKERCGLRF